MISLWARTIDAYLLEALGVHTGNQGRVVLIEGPDTAPTSRDHGVGFCRAIAARPGISLLGSAPGRYLQAGGRKAVATLLAAHPRIDGVICTNDSMALGALEPAGRRWVTTAPRRRRRPSPKVGCRPS